VRLSPGGNAEQLTERVSHLATLRKKNRRVKSTAGGRIWPRALSLLGGTTEQQESGRKDSRSPRRFAGFGAWNQRGHSTCLCFCRKLRGSKKAAEKTAAVQDASRDLEHGISEDIQLVYDAFAARFAAAKKRQKRQPQSKTLREIWSMESARTFNLSMTLLP
jgi:hypothetical protein